MSGGRTEGSARELFTVTLLSGASVLLSLLGNRLLTGAVPPGVLGELYLFMNLAAWFTLPTTGAYIYISRYWLVARHHGSAHRFSRALFTGLGFQVLLCAVGTALCWWTGLQGVTGAAALALLVVSACQGVTQGLSPVQQLERRRVTAGLLDLLSGPGRGLWLWGFWLLCGGLGASALLVVQAGHSLLVVLVTAAALALLLRRVPPDAAAAPHAHLGRAELLRHLVPYGANAALGQVAGTLERWGLARSGDAARTALFVQAVGLSTAAASAATGALGTYFTPLMTAAAARDERDPIGAAWPLVRRYLGSCLLVLCALVATMTLAAGPLTRLFFGERYASVSLLLPWTTLGASAFALGQSSTFVSILARDTLGPNLTRAGGLLLYVGSLALLHLAPEPAVSFARAFALAQLLYLAACLLVAWRLRRAGSVISSPG